MGTLGCVLVAILSGSICSGWAFGQEGGAGITGSRPAPGVAIHVAVDGSDERDGRGPDRAVRTLARAMELVQPGGRVLLRRGDVWRETLRPRHDHLIIECYGEGALPVISGADPVADLSPVLEGKAGLWMGPLATNPAQVFIDGQRGQRMAAEADVQAPGQWHWDSARSRLTIQGADEAPPKVEASTRDTGVDLDGRADMTLRHLRIERAGREGILARTLDRSTIEECEIAGCYIAGLQLGGKEMRTDLLIRRNRISDCGGTGIGFGGQLNNWIIEENEIEACGILTQHIVGFGDGRERSLEWTAGIKIWGWGADGWVGYYAIRHNRVLGCKPVAWAPKPEQTHGHGIWADEVLKPTARPEIHGNTVNDCFANGIYLEKTDDHDVFDNLVVDCGQTRYTAALHAQSNPFGYDVTLDQPDPHAPRQVSGNRIFHNTAVGGWWSLSVSASSPNCSISNTEVRDNIFVRRNGRPGWIYLHGGGANDGLHGSGNRYVRNTFGPEGSQASWVWGKATFRDYVTLETASEGAVSESVPSPPLFQDEAAGNFQLRAPLPRRDEAGDDSNTSWTDGTSPCFGCREVREYPRKIKSVFQDILPEAPVQSDGSPFQIGWLLSPFDEGKKR